MREPQSLPIRGRDSDEPELRDSEYFTRLAYRKSGTSRHTQDTPILADVLVHYGLLKDKEKRLDLLLTPDWSKEPGEVAEELAQWLGEKAPSDEPEAEQDQDATKPIDLAPLAEGDHAIAYNQSVVAAKLTFEELVVHVLPMSWWWQNRLVAVPDRTPVEVFSDPKLKTIARSELLEGLELQIQAENREARRDEDDDESAPENQNGTRGDTGFDQRGWLLRQELAWAARLFYIVHTSNVGGEWHEPADDAQRIADTFLGVLDRITSRQAECAQAEAEEKRKQRPSDPWIYSVNRNRRIYRTVVDSVRTTKADAARTTFGATGEGICWAVIDTGIDAQHIAFRKSDGDESYQDAFDSEGNHTRVKATYDFSDIRSKLSKAQLRSLLSGRLLNWEEAANRLQLEVKHSDRGEYRTPLNGHGTHVAGILGADWHPDATAADPLGPPPRNTERKAIVGLCPEIEFYDLRVFRNDVGDEFAVMSALQFVRSLNQRHDNLEVHGVNLSLAMLHEVSNYACGRSPVCEECSRLVGTGVVVVAAAGNEGRSIHTTTQNRKQEGYRTVSIADPGNTEAVITVGSTHRKEPHTYGVSYFSSRGPTGDGRAKPDLVAPGEKILSTVPGDSQAREDGTSQAAPHISGAAALLMSRHRELIGQPERIKRILMDTATDLGREHDFQGAGLVDVMRAIQSL